jgi:hypothetical protein
VQTQKILTQRRIHYQLTGLVATLALLAMTTLTVAAQFSPERPSEYRVCWVGSQFRYLECVDANSWGASFVFEAKTSPFLFPDPDDASLRIDDIPSY